MNENAKKGLLIAVIVLALGGVGIMVAKNASSDQPNVVKTVGGPVVNEKEAAMAKQAEAGGTKTEGDPGGG